MMRRTRLGSWLTSNGRFIEYIGDMLLDALYSRLEQAVHSVRLQS